MGVEPAPSSHLRPNSTRAAGGPVVNSTDPSDNQPKTGYQLVSNLKFNTEQRPKEGSTPSDVEYEKNRQEYEEVAMNKS